MGVYFDTTGWIFWRPTATRLQDIAGISVFADVITVSCSHKDKWVPRAVHSGAREQGYPTSVPAPEAPGPQGAQPGVMLGVPQFVKVDWVGAGSWILELVKDILCPSLTYYPISITVLVC